MLRLGARQLRVGNPRARHGVTFLLNSAGHCHPIRLRAELELRYFHNAGSFQAIDINGGLLIGMLNALDYACIFG